MRTFICALLILLAMLGAVIGINRRISREASMMVELVSHLPKPSDHTCEARTAALEAKWYDIRPLVGIAINGRSIDEIDRLVASLCVFAAGEEGMDTEGLGWEHYRAQLLLQLGILKRQTGCGIWEII
jgi:hypothetical protein